MVRGLWRRDVGRWGRGEESDFGSVSELGVWAKAITFEMVA
jgi:hypothetical protein